jgi:retron-type reverse transcriptase
MDKSNLPYFKNHATFKDIYLYHFLCKKFIPSLRKYLPYHYLLTYDLRKYFKFVNKTSKKYPVFLRLDIKNYFPSINHQTLLKEIPNNYFKLTNKNLSRRFQKYLKNDIPEFLSQSPFLNRGLPLGNPLSYILSGLYLLKLDLSLNVPFLRFCDDYLLFFKNRK